jgi:hypothetical protein
MVGGAAAPTKNRKNYDYVQFLPYMHPHYKFLCTHKVSTPLDFALAPPLLSSMMATTFVGSLEPQPPGRKVTGAAAATTSLDPPLHTKLPVV